MHVYPFHDPAKCQATFDKFMEFGNVSELVPEPYGDAVLPTIGKEGVGVGGEVDTPLLFGPTEEGITYNALFT